MDGGRGPADARAELTPCRRGLPALHGLRGAPATLSRMTLLRTRSSKPMGAHDVGNWLSYVMKVLLGCVARAPRAHSSRVPLDGMQHFC